MTITFHCEHCDKEINAPDSAGGKRGKCPFCGQSNYVPTPVNEDEVLPLAPIDEEEERQREQEVKKLLEKDRVLLAASGGEPAPATEDRPASGGEDLHHLVVNYCLDMVNGNLNRAGTYIPQLKKFGGAGIEAVEDFLSGRFIEPALDVIPTRVLHGFLAQLKTGLSS